MSVRQLHSHAGMARVMNARSVAVVGVSPNAISLGARTKAHLEQFKGSVYLVNRKYQLIDDRPCYPSIASLPETPDCVLIAVPREGVEEAVVECAERGVGGVVIFASGYAESRTQDGVDLQKRLSSISCESGMRIIGPNCMGFMNLSKRLIASFVGAAIPLDSSEACGIGLISQSGSIGFSMSQAMHVGVPFSHVITPGNSCDVTIADSIAYLAEDPCCKVIACVFEGLPEPMHIIEAGEIAWKAGKPLIMYKLGAGVQGAQAMMSHTATLAGSYEAYRAAFERTGMILVNDFKALIETAAFFNKVNRPQSTGVAVVSGSGGMAIAYADMAEIHGIPLPQPSEEIRRGLLRFMPDFGAPRNPVDATAMAGRNEGHVGCLDTMLADPTYGLGVLPLPLLQTATLNRLKLVSEVSARHRKPICIVWANGWTGGPGMKEVERDPNLVLFQSIDRCFATVSAWFNWGKRRKDWDSGIERETRRLSPASARLEAEKRIADCQSSTLTERESKEILALYGISVVSDRVVQSSADAVKAAVEQGFPVVMKVESPDIPHKTEAGVVRLGVNSKEDVAMAYELVMENAGKVPGNPRIYGVLVQPMISKGTEVFIGAKIDPMFGPLIVAGMGGVFVEVFKDIAVKLAPVRKREAIEMLESLKGHSLLNGFRGAKPVDLEALAEVIVRVSEFASDCKASIETLDVNPLICNGSSIVVVDSLITRTKVTAQKKAPRNRLLK